MTRYLFGFMCVCALGVMPLVGCSEATPECQIDEDCDDQNVCTDDTCVGGSCDHIPVYDGTKCDFDGLAGVCISGVCAENPCDDGNECTENSYQTDGSCFFPPGPSNDFCDFDGVPGVCSGGVCIEDLCEGVVCEDDGDTCTVEKCEHWNGKCYSYNAGFPAGTPCTLDGVPGVCVSGECGENLCEGVVCDDDDPCTDEGECSYYDGMCHFRPHCRPPECHDVWCDPANGACVVTPQDGTRCGTCSERECVDGVCKCTCTGLFCCLCIP